MQLIGKIVLLGVLLVATQNAKCQQPLSNNNVGEWVLTNSDDVRWVFLENGTFKEYIGNLEYFSKYNPRRKSNRYKVKEESDTIWLYLTLCNILSNGEKVIKKFTRRYAVQINGDHLAMISYKGAGVKEKYDAIYNHVDEYTSWFRKGTNQTMNKKIGTHVKYILPEGFKGAVWIAFNQPNGFPPAYDSLGNAVLKIPENGLLLTSLHEDVFATANKNYSISEEKKGGGQYYSYQSYDKFDKFDSTCCKFDEYIAVMCGYNQDGRDAINKIFGKAIQGNIMTIYIGKYRWFEQNLLHPWDSKMD